MESNKIPLLVAGAMVLAILIGAALYFASGPSQEELVATTTVKVATTTETRTGPATSTKPAVTPATKPAVVSPSAHMKASDFLLFLKAGKCVKTAHSAPLQGYRAIDFVKTTIAVNQEAWKCSDGEYYTP